METPSRSTSVPAPGQPAKPRRGAAARALDGAAFLPRGIRAFLATPGVRLLGIAPVLLAMVIAAVVLVLLVLWIDEVAALATPFADDWSETARTGLRVLAGLALAGVTLGLLVVSFAALVNLIGQPFYERIADRIETRMGTPLPQTGVPWWRSWPRATAESVTLLAIVLATAVPLFLLGLIPVVGQTVAPVAGVTVSGFLLAIELLAIPLERRGLRLHQRLRFAWANRATVAGFGVAAFLLFLVPLMNIVAMPGAIVGGVLLARHLHATPRP